MGLFKQIIDLMFRLRGYDSRLCSQKWSGYT